MKKTAMTVVMALAVLASLVIGSNLQAQPAFPPDGGGDTNTYSDTNQGANIYTPPRFVPGLQLAIPQSSGTNLFFNLLQADPAGTYDIFAASNLASASWNDVLGGTNGQTNFTLTFPFMSLGFFRVARTDTPVVNTAGMTVNFPNNNVNTNITSAVISGGPAAALAVLVNDTNLADAVWLPFSAVPNVLLGTNDGTYQVTFGFIGSDGQTNWTTATVTLDTTPPPLVITGPTNATVDVPLIQLTGFSPEALGSISYDITNAAGLMTNQQVLITAQYSDTNAWKFTTNWFQCFDVSLTNGINAITLHATDLAGNTTTTNIIFTLDYSTKTNPPIVQIAWPQNGMQICGTNFTFHGQLDDSTEKASVQMVDASGNTNTANGSVGRDGIFWFENLPLNTGTNALMLTVADAAGNTTVTNLSLIQSSVALTINSVSAGQTTVSGTIDTSGYKIWVNGTNATQPGNGTWSAQIAPIIGGAGVVEATAIPNSDNGGNGSGSDAVGNPMSAQSKNALSAVGAKLGIYYASYHYHEHREVPASSAIGDWTVDWSDGASSTEKNETWNWSVGSPYLYSFYQWPAASWSQGLSYFGNEIYYNGSWHTNAYFGAVPLREEYAHNLTETHNPKNIDYGALGETIKIDEQVDLKLSTGGDPGSTVKNLFVISAPHFNAEVYNFLTGIPVPPQQVSIGGLGNLGADGNLYVVLPDNATDIDVTPRVNGLDWFSFNITVQKYPLTLTASTNGTAIDISTNTPEFCVGQQVTFTLNGLPGGIVNMVGSWNLPDKFVNEPYMYSSTCTSYRINYDLLANTPSTSCWFVNGNGGTVSVGLSLYFNNGQYASVAAKGSFTVFRPKILGHEFVSSGAVELNTNDLSNIRLGMLYPGSDYINWTTDVEMKQIYPGTLSCQQLVDWEASYDIGLYCVSKGDTTGGQYWLDNTATAADIHSPNGTTFSASQGIPFNDGPEMQGSFCTLAQLTPSFKTYLRFQPDGGIPITLERAEWTESGRADSNGSAWSLTTHYVDGPNFYPDDSFPVWLQTFINHE